MAEIHQELQNVLGSYLSDNPGADRDLADEFEVAVSTVKRWANGTSRPHPILTRRIIDSVKNKSKAG